MSKTVFKYLLGTIGHPIDIEMPQGSRLLTVQLQGGLPTLWALVDTTKKMTKRVVILTGTGHDSTNEFGDYLGTVQTKDGLVWHAFEARGKS